MKLVKMMAAAMVCGAAGLAVGQETNPPYHIRAYMQTADNGQWGANEEVGDTDVHVHSRLFQVYYGGVLRHDDFRFTMDISFRNVRDFSTQFAGSPYNTNFDAYLNNAFVGRIIMNQTQLGDGTLAYDSRHPGNGVLPLPINFPEPISAGDTMRFFAAAPVLPAIGTALPNGVVLFQGTLQEQLTRGDANGDGQVNDLDYAILAANYDPFHLLGAHVGPAAGDFTGDNLCDLEDYEVMAQNWTGTDQVPPPPAPVAGGCYANCDNSVTPPVLNVNDFICFQTKFAAGESGANCDQSTVPPVLNVNDFICFQMKFAAGCP